MFDVSSIKLTTDEMGTLLGLIFLMNEIPGIKVYLEGKAEFRVHYADGCHSHLMCSLEDFESLHESVRNIIKSQHEYNLDNHLFYTHEELKEAGLKSHDVLLRHPDKTVSILSRSVLDKYNNRIKEIIED